MNWKHYAILSAPILLTIASHLSGASHWGDVVTPKNLSEVVAQTAAVLVALKTSKPADTEAISCLQDANDDLRKRVGSWTGTSDR